MIPTPPVTVPVLIIPLPLCKVVLVVSTELPRVMLVFVVAIVPARFNWELLLAVRPPAKVRASVAASPRVVVPVFPRTETVTPLTLPPERTLRLYAPVKVFKLVAFNVPLKVTSLPEVVALILTAPTVTPWLKVAPPLLVMVIPPDMLKLLLPTIKPTDPESRVKVPAPVNLLLTFKSIFAPVGLLLPEPVVAIEPPGLT